MFFYEGQSCPVCQQHFGENDDIVTCPICGAPHHRDCWKAEGHCHFAADHGTERQWAKGASDEPVKHKPTPKQHCQNCGAENPEFAEFCSHCGRELNATAWQSAPPPRVHHFTPPHGGFVPPDKIRSAVCRVPIPSTGFRWKPLRKCWGQIRPTTSPVFCICTVRGKRCRGTGRHFYCHITGCCIAKT